MDTPQSESITYRSGTTMRRRAGFVALGGIGIVGLFWLKARQHPEVFQPWLVLIGLVGAFGVFIYLCLVQTVRNVSVSLEAESVTWTTLMGRQFSCPYNQLTIQEIRTTAGTCYRIGRPGSAHFTISDVIMDYEDLIDELDERAGPGARMG